MKPHDCGAESGYRSGVLTIHEKRPELEPKAQDIFDHIKPFSPETRMRKD
jgi:hypothetical protein